MARPRSLCLGATLLVAALLRADHLGRSLWFDEAFCLRLVRFSWREMLARIERDVHPPFYFLLLKLWAMGIGTSPTALRSLSVTFGVATVAATYGMIAEACDGDRPRTPRTVAAALTASALVALAPYQIFWGSQVKMYALATLLAALSSWALFRMLRRTPPRGAALLYGASALAFAYTHYYALFSIAAQALFLVAVMIKRRRAREPVAPLFRRAAVAGAVVAAGWLPWAPIFLWQRAQVGALWWIDVAPSGFYGFKLWYRILFELSGASGHLWLEYGASVASLALLWPLARHGGRGGVYLVVASLVPLLCGLLASHFGPTVLLVRYLLVMQLFVLSSVAALIHLAPRGWQRAAATAAALAFVAALSLAQHRRLYLPERTDARGAADYLASVRRAGEPAVFDPLEYFPLRAYAPAEHDLWVYAPGGSLPHYLGGPILTDGDPLIDDAALARLGGRVFLVDSDAEGRAVKVPPGWRAGEQRAFPAVWPEGSSIRVTAYETR